MNEQTRLKIKASCQGVNKGIKRSKETRLKISISKTKLPGTMQEKRRFFNQRYEAREVGAEGSHTYLDWINLKNLYGNMCLCCKLSEPEVKIIEDHIIPLSKGGTDYITNIQPLCLDCNDIKKAKTISFLPSDNKIYKERVG